MSIWAAIGTTVLLWLGWLLVGAAERGKSGETERRLDQ